MQGIYSGGETGDDLLAKDLDENALWHQIDSGDMPPAEEPALNPPRKRSYSAVASCWLTVQNKHH